MDATQEQWRPVRGCEGYYEVSDAGRVRTLPHAVRTKSGSMRIFPAVPTVLKPKVKRYAEVVLYGPNGRLYRSVHSLVLESFVGPRPAGLVACHANDVGTDNRLENLRWDTHSANTQECVANGLHPKANQTHCVNGHEFNSVNTRIYITPDGKSWRRCRQCRRDRNRRNP